MRRYLGETTVTQIKDWFVKQCSIELETVRNKEDLMSQKHLIKKVIQKMDNVVTSQNGIKIDDKVEAEINAIKKKLRLSGEGADKIAIVIFLAKDASSEIADNLKKTNKNCDIKPSDFYQVMMAESFKYKNGDFGRSLYEETGDVKNLISDLAAKLGYINEFDKYWADNPEINKIEVEKELEKKDENRSNLKGGNRMRGLRRGFRESDLSDVADVYMRKAYDYMNSPDFDPYEGDYSEYVREVYGQDVYDAVYGGKMDDFIKESRMRGLNRRRGFREETDDMEPTITIEELDNFLDDAFSLFDDPDEDVMFWKKKESRMRRSSRRFRESEDEVLVMEGEKVGLVIEKSTGRGMSAPKTVKKSFVAPGDLGEKGIVGLIMLALKRKPMELNGNVTFKGLEEVMRDECADGSDFVSKIVLPNEVITLVD